MTIAPEIDQSPSEGGLSLAEHAVVRAAQDGRLVILPTGKAGSDAEQEGAGDAGRIIRASVLAELLTGQLTEANRRPRAVKVSGALITGPLDLEGAELICPLVLVSCDLEGGIILTDATAPAIRLSRCRLPSLAADRLRTTGAFQLNHGTATRGYVSLTGASIGGVFDLCGANLNNPAGRALSADLLTVEHSMLCQDGFTARGEIRLAGARIGGRLDLREATLVNPGRCALSADGLRSEYGILCKEGFTALGEIRLAYSRLGGVLNFTGASLSNPSGTALDLEAAEIAALWLLPVHRPDGVVNLTGTKADSFRDDRATWPATLRLRGFTYDTLENDQASVPDRLDWLTRDQGGYTPQLYDQLAAAYQRIGQEEAARKVRIAKQRNRRAVLNTPGKALNWLLYLTVGYGYRTWLAAAWLAGLLAIGTCVFGCAYPTHMVRTSAYAAAFNPVAYSLDVLLPIVNLGQQSSWQPQGWALYWSWALTGAGWVLTTAVVAGLTGVLKRD